MSALSRNWIVSVASEDADDLIFGPYTRSRAEALSDRFNELVTTESYGSWVHATCYPIRPLRIRELVAEFGQ